MCGRVIQSSGPLRYAIVDGMNVRDSRVHNYPPRWDEAPSQELLVRTGEVSLDPPRWGLIPYWCNDPAGGRGASGRGTRWRSCLARPFHGPRFATTVPSAISEPIAPSGPAQIRINSTWITRDVEGLLA
jgi:SOS response associated peptidase (SRAP)